MSETKAIMFYDGGCPMCSREVDLYRRIDRRDRIEFVDISRDTHLLQALGVAPDAAMRRLHVLSADGVMTDGVFAFAALWRQLPGLRVLAAILHGLRLLGSLDRLYERFARARYRRRCDATRPIGASCDGAR